MDHTRRSDPRSHPVRRHASRDIVRRLAQRKRLSAQLTDEEYPDIHGALVAACRRAQATADVPWQAFYRTLEERVAPWVTLATLARADSEFLADLLADCQEVDQALGTARPEGLTWPVVVGWLLVAGLTAAIAHLVLTRGQSSWLSLIPWPPGLHRGLAAWVVGGGAVCALVALVRWLVAGRGRR